MLKVTTGKGCEETKENAGRKQVRRREGGVRYVEGKGVGKTKRERRRKMVEGWKAK